MSKAFSLFSVFGKLVHGQCPEAKTDRSFLYPVVDDAGPHLGCNLEEVITKSQSELDSACPTSNRGRQ